MAKQKDEPILPRLDQEKAPYVKPEPSSALTGREGEPWFRVSLKGLKPLVKVPVTGQNKHQDFLDVQAAHEGEACQKFRKYSGITSSIHTEVIERLPDGLVAA